MARILIVESDEQTSVLVAKSLHGRGHQTRVESNGAAALLAAHKDLPDLILMDLMMPILEGQETLHALRHDPRTAHIPVIVLSDRDDAQAMAGAFTAGANVYMLEPPDLQELHSLVERLVMLKPGDAFTR